MKKILVYVVKMWRTLHNNDINQNPGPKNLIKYVLSVNG